MAANVESQRLISLSLGKIAQSRSQKGGINLHKNLLVATVLHKARTACMMEFQRQRQLEFQQRQQQQKDAAALEFEAKQEQARSAALSLAAFNTAQPQQSVIPTCVREMEEQDQSCDAQPESDAPTSDPVPHELDVNVGQGSVAPSQNHTVECVSSPRVKAPAPDTCNKENSPPVQYVNLDLDSDSEDELDLDIGQTAAQVVPQSAVLPTPVDHLVAATQLSEDSASDLSSRKSQTSAAPTCNVLKRQRENWVTTSHEHECPPATKKARLVASASRRDSRNGHVNNAPEPDTCSYQPSSCSSDSNNQISNLVNIFNSGFTGLCDLSSLSPQTSSEELSSSCDNVSDQYTQSDSLSISSSLSCSSSLGRMDSIPSAIGLVLSV
ncbi:immediate early response gene 5-like protein [Elysia marginata]|uniref:Immediate early response gene 5-like protein n=1 Tax=Elysia marginata TaxID=1093978 RepID=A0AAV4JNH8_9GAST|nr:immediate early response gene 5-like protein [Elysia marginata]